MTWTFRPGGDNYCFFFFFEGKIYFIQREIGIQQRESTRNNQQINKLGRMSIEKVLKHWRGDTLPDLCGFRRSCKSSKIMSCSIVFPFQMLKFPAAEGMKRVENPLKDMAKGTSCVFSIYGLDDWEGVGLDDDFGDLQFLINEESNCYGNRLHWELCW